MHTYLPHLLSDIANAHRAEMPEEEESEKSLEEYFEAIERWISGEEEHCFGYYCGLSPEDFPPAEQFTEEEMMLVRRTFDEMMLTWNHRFHFPDNLPISFAYKLMVNSLNEKTGIVNSGYVNIDFCSGYAPDCELKEYCPCIEFWNDDVDDMDIDLKEGELPF